MRQKIDNFFGITRLGSSYKIEIFAGVSTFLSLSYIFVVNPAILSAAGISTSVAFFATIVGSVIATLLMGLWARLPFAVAPGLEMNAYVAYVVVGVLGFTWQGALGAIFWSGVLTVLLSFTSLRVNIVKAIPDKLKSGLAASVGVFLMLIALKVSGVLAYEGIQVKGFGLLASHEAMVFYAGLILVAALKYFKVKGAVIISIIGAAIFAHFLGVSQAIEPIKLSKEMFAGTFALDWGIIFNPKIWSVIIILFILDFYGSIAKFIGLTRNTNIVDSEGNLPKMKEGLIVDGAGTVIGAVTGTSNLITYVESAVGIGEGGRTGIVAVVVAGLMSLFLFIVPLINLIPVVATTGAVFFVGLMLFPNKKDLKEYSWTDKIAVGLMVIVTVWTFGLDKAMFAGFAAFVASYVISGNWRKLNAYLIGSTAILLLSILLSK
ncbi:MAG: NCS2 family permease [Janthinobacterium sp.]|jgi:AGZA family xanthine/uracil permease-like MFS transporter